MNEISGRLVFADTTMSLLIYYTITAAVIIIAVCETAGK